MKTIWISAALMLSAAAPVQAEVSIARGEYLVRGPMGCGNCHTPLGPTGPVAGAELSGRLVEDTPAFTAWAPNITPAARIAHWSDAELGRAIREGLRPDGSLVGPPMPVSTYRHISDDDLGSIVAFLRTLPAVENETPPSVYNIPLPPAYGPPIESVAAPDSGVTAEWGGYVVALSHCMECHTPRGPQGELLDEVGRGGLEFVGPWGVSYAKNITPHPDGIGDYDDDELKAMITKGVRPDGEAMMPPMPYPFLARMTPEDLEAVVVYLRSLPPLPNG